MSNIQWQGYAVWWDFYDYNKNFQVTLPKDVLVNLLLWFQYDFIIDPNGKSSNRHVSGSESIQTNNSQVPLTNSVGDKTPYLGHKRRSIFGIESLVFLSILGTQNGRINSSSPEGNNKVRNKNSTII